MSTFLMTEAESAVQNYKRVQNGVRNHSSFKIYITINDSVISPMHDIPYHISNDVYNMVVEIPRFENAKLEISRELPGNPIIHDVATFGDSKGKLRYLRNLFPYHGVIWNYGSLPQTWESPEHHDQRTGRTGDNDPLDILEIGGRVWPPGTVLRVKILGAFGQIDKGETDWKLLGISVDDPLAPELNRPEDVERLMPGLLAATLDWFSTNKAIYGLPGSAMFVENGKFFPADFTFKLIEEYHELWKEMSRMECTSLNIESESRENLEVQIDHSFHYHKRN